MAYPPPLPPTSRTNTTPSFDNHPGDHNAIVSALADIIAELGSNPSAGASDLTALMSTMMPVGAVTVFAGTAVPTNWLLCDGTAVNRTTYAALLSVIGLSYGTGDGVNTFNVPNLMAKFIFGGTIAGTGGQRDAIIPAHYHPMAHQHTLGGHTHSHDPAVNGGKGTRGIPTGWPTNPPDTAANVIFASPGQMVRTPPNFPISTAPTDWFSQTLTVASSTGGVNANDTTAGGAANTSGAVGEEAVTDKNMPPYMTMRYIIKAA